MYFKSEIVLTACYERLICNSLFQEEKLPSEMFYDDIKKDSKNVTREVWTAETGDTIKNCLWNDGRPNFS